MKGVICAGGQATRLGELTKNTNKHLLPVHQWPMIYYPLTILQQAGIKDILLVTGSEHCGTFVDLLKDGRVKDREGNERIFDLNLTYKVQVEAGGIAQAVGLARDFVGNDKFIVMLGDNIIEGNIIEAVKNFEMQPSGARIFLKDVPDPQRFGVARFDENEKLVEVIEKPQNPPSNFAVVGIYMYPASVFEIIKTLVPSGRGELEITDVNQEYLRRGQLEYEKLQGWWRDVGTHEAFAKVGSLISETGACKIEL